MSILKKSSRMLLFQRAFLFLLLTYFTLVGGVYTGLISFTLQRVSLLLISGVATVWLGWRLMTHREFPSTSLDIAWLISLLVMFITSITSSDPRRSVMELTQFILIGLSFYLLIDLLRAGWSTELLIKIMLLTSLTTIIVSLYQFGSWYFNWIKVSGWSNPIPLSSYRVSAFIGNPNLSAAYFNILLPLGLVRLLKSTCRRDKVLWGLWSLTVVFLIFMTSSRGGWLATLSVIFVFVLLLLIQNRQNVIQWWHRSGRRGLLITGLAFSLIIGIGITFIFFFWQTKSTVSAGTGLQFGSRGYIWGAAIDIFIKRPIFGNGPFTFGTEWARRLSNPPETILAYAHNHILNILSGTGLLGLGASALFVIRCIQLIIRRWQDIPLGSRYTLIGIIASFTGVAVHSQFDTPLLLPSLALMVVLLLSTLCYSETVRVKPSVKKTASFGLHVLVLTILIGLVWNVWSYKPAYEGATAANRGEWNVATAKLDEATRRDPWMAFYWFEAGYAHGELGLNPDGSVNNIEEIKRAIQMYVNGLHLEPNYSVNWANYGMLEWASGNKTEGVNAFSKAAGLAYQQPYFNLTYSRMAEELGENEIATKVYQHILENNPQWVNSYFFRATQLRRQIASQILLSDIKDPIPQVPVDEASLKRSIFSFQGGEGYVDNLFRLGKIYSEQGRYTEASDAYQQGLKAIQQVTAYGIGMMGASSYGWMVYNRESIAPDLLPGIEAFMYTDSRVQAIMDLGLCYEKLNEKTKALDLYRTVLSIAPDNSLIQEKVKSLTQ